MIDKGVQQAVMEVSSIALDQFRTWGCRFQVGVFTNLTQDHLDYHGTFDEYYAAKLRFFRDYQLPTAVVNQDDVWGKRLLKDATAAQVWSYSLREKADFCVIGAKYLKDRTEAQLTTPEGKFLIQSPFIGEYNLANCVGMIAAAHGAGAPIRDAVAVLKEVQGVRGRVERVTSGATQPHVFVDYAHTPDALEKVLQELSRIKKGNGGKLITVFGCGGDRDRSKRPLMGKIAEQLSDLVVVTSDNPRTEDPDKIVDDIEVGMNGKQLREVNRKAAIEKALAAASPDDIVLVAGKGHEDYQIIGTTKIHFDDAEVVRQFYKLALEGQNGC
jgi:UDP-N-acetylmuramoyl-L-alanyl-D-glutamate--2,6-diaminopimelate ligase